MTTTKRPPPLLAQLASAEKQKRVEALCIDIDAGVIDAFQQMDRLDRKLLIVVQDGRYTSLLSGGDIQRYLVAGGQMTAPVRASLGRNVTVARPGTKLDDIRAIMLRVRAEFMPVVDTAGALVDVIFWDELFQEPHRVHLTKLKVPTVIMAGGRGARLKPITNIIPKPLVPIGERPIIEIIMDSFHECGVEEFHVSVNYKADMIERYFAERSKPYQIRYFTEPMPLGTAGSLSLLKERLNQTFFVSNCDILIDQEYQEIFQYHREKSCDITVVAALKTYAIPYGTLETGPDSLLVSLREKPHLNMLVNTGVYLLEPHVLKEVSGDRVFHITELIERVRLAGGRVGVFPISEGAWLDIGEWPEYQKTQEAFQQRSTWSLQPKGSTATTDDDRD